MNDLQRALLADVRKTWRTREKAALDHAKAVWKAHVQGKLPFSKIGGPEGTGTGKGAVHKMTRRYEERLKKMNDG